MTDGTERQADFWHLLGDTRVVEDAAGRLVRPGKGSEPHAKGPASLDAQINGRGISALGKLTGAGRNAGTETWADKGSAKHKLTIRQARYGNRAVVVRRD